MLRTIRTGDWVPEQQILKWLLVLVCLVVFPFDLHSQERDGGKGAGTEPATEPSAESPANQEPRPQNPSSEKKDETKKEEPSPPTEKPPAEKPPAKPPVKNPVTESLTETFTRKKDKDKENAGANEATPGNPAKKVARTGIEARAPSEKRSEDLMRRALAAIAENNWKDALDLLQKIAALPEDNLHRTDSGQWISVQEEAQRLIGTAPPEPLVQYQKQYAGLAKQLLVDAQHSGRISDFVALAKTYLHTEAGYEAANRLGTWHFDRQETALAAKWFTLLWQVRAATTNSPTWRAKASLTLRQMGNQSLAQEILDLSSQPANSAIPGLAGGSRSASKWLASLPKLTENLEAPLNEWKMFFGSSRRNGIAAGGPPLLLARWHVAASERKSVLDQIERLREELADAGQFPLPMSFPTMINGKIILRTLHGVQVLDAESGNALWQTDQLQPVEQLLADSARSALPQPESVFNRAPFNRARFVMNNGVNTGVVDQPLCHLLFRNSNFGITSSDGNRLFVVDDPIAYTRRLPGIPVNWNNPADVDSHGSGSRLAAYDLATGRLQWEIGGNLNGEAFDPPLAGNFFFGAPAVDGGDLFVVGESTSGDTNKQIRLICLDAARGEVKWTQLIAHSDPDIEKDLCRRWWTAQISVADGMLICPTTVGWTVAVDRVTHRLLWGHRSSALPRPAINRFGNQGGETDLANMVGLWSLKEAWGPAPPVVQSGCVLFSSPEGQNFVCLDQTLGKELWTKSRGTNAYFAGVHNRLAIIVGWNEISAWKFENGGEAWQSIKIPAPSGRGVFVGDRLYVPLSNGEIWTIDAASGTVTAKTSLPAGAPAGNLAMYRGMLLAADALGITAFEQRDDMEREIARRLKNDPQDPWALIRQAQVKRMERDLTGVLSLLRQVARDRVPSELLEMYRELLVESLFHAVIADPNSPMLDANLAELESILKSSGERLQFQRLKADSATSSQRFGEAFDLYLSIAKNQTGMIPRDSPGKGEVRADLWAEQRIEVLIAKWREVDAPAVDKRLADLNEELLKTNEVGIEFPNRILARFAPHPHLAAERRLQKVDALAARGEFAAAERELLSLSDFGDQAIEATALERLARLLLEFQLPAEAAERYAELETKYAETPLGKFDSAAKLVQELRTAGKLPLVEKVLVDWHSDAVRAERIGIVPTGNQPAQEVKLTGGGSFFARHHIEFDGEAERLDFIDAETDGLYWSTPLRGRTAPSEGGALTARAANHQLTVLQQGYLYGLSPIEKRVLWNRPVESRLPAPVQNFRSPANFLPMQPAASLANARMVANTQGIGTGGMVQIGSNAIGVLGRRTLAVYDSLTGDTLWTLGGVRVNSTILAGLNVVYIRPPDGVKPRTVSARDGTDIETRNLEVALNRTLQLVGDQLVLSGLADGKPGLRLYDPIADRNLWTIALGPQTKFSFLENDRAAVLEGDGKFGLLDLKTGHLQSFAPILAEELKGRETLVIVDNASLFLLLNKGPINNSGADQVAFVRANGKIMAFDLETGKKRWSEPKEVQQQNLLLERFSSSPYLVFSNREFKQQDQLGLWWLELLVIDKYSGNVLFKDKMVSQPGFRAIGVNAAERYVELRGYTERIRLFPSEQPASAGQSGG